jgi:membrane-bound serine protease (ClpP class)
MEKDRKVIRLLSQTACLVIIWIMIGIGQQGIAAEPDKPQPETHEIWVATVKDTINPMVAEYLRDIIERAEKDAVVCLIIELDTPGGVLETTHAIVQSEMNSQIPIVVYVTPKGARAASAGMFITIASHIAAMAPATNIGAAHPVSSGPVGPGAPEQEEKPGNNEEGVRSGGMMDGSAMEQKIMNDTLAWARTIAENRHRNMDWVRSAIVDSISSTEQEALEKGVIDLVSETRNTLIAALDGKKVTLSGTEIQLNTKDAVIVEKPMTFRQKFLSILINPTIAIYLLMGGLIGIYIELTHPGFIFPGVTGAISLILALFAMHALPINYAGLILLLLSFVFFIAEVKIQSYGMLMIGGVVAFLLGASILVNSEIPGMEVSMKAIIPLAIAVAGLTVFLVSLVVRSHSIKPQTGYSGMLGLKGKVKKAIDPKGKVFVRGELWYAVSHDKSAIPVDQIVEVISTKNLTLIVKRVDSDTEEVIA